MMGEGTPHVLRSTRVVLPDGVRPARVVMRMGSIERVLDHGDVGDGQDELRDLVVMPGLVDSHVHINEPGRADWEGFATASRAAIAGGITTLVDMPLNSIPATTTVRALAEKRAAADRVCGLADHYFWGGVVPGNVHELEPLARAGVRGFKCFLVPSGVPEFEHVGEAELRAAMPVIAKLGLPLLVHAEVPGPIERAMASLGTVATPTRYADYARSRPPAAELEAIGMLIRLCREFGTRTHIVHLATAAAVPMIERARAEGLPLTCETCPHYLYFSDDRIADGSVAHKCAPPIRDDANRVALWDALVNGTIDLVASDHSPAPPAVKDDGSGDLFRAWGGIASLQLGLSIMWTLARERGIGPEHLARWMSAAPAELAGLDETKGRIAPGCDADLVVFDPDAEWIVDPAGLQHRHPITPYAGERLRGSVVRTFRGGRLACERGTFLPVNLVREARA